MKHARAYLAFLDFSERFSSVNTAFALSPDKRIDRLGSRTFFLRSASSYCAGSMRNFLHASWQTYSENKGEVVTYPGPGATWAL